jgi:hypothetical protein
VFQRLRQLRLIDYGAEENLELSEAWLRIHPMIVDFVSVDAIEAARGARQAEAAVAPVTRGPDVP